MKNVLGLIGGGKLRPGEYPFGAMAPRGISAWRSMGGLYGLYGLGLYGGWYGGRCTLNRSNNARGTKTRTPKTDDCNDTRLFCDDLGDRYLDDG